MISSCVGASMILPVNHPSKRTFKSWETRCLNQPESQSPRVPMLQCYKTGHAVLPAPHLNLPNASYASFCASQEPFNVPIISQFPRKNQHTRPPQGQPRYAIRMPTMVTGRTAQAPTLSASSVEAVWIVFLSFSCLPVPPGPIRLLKNTKITAKFSFSYRAISVLNVLLWARSV